jgi:hypothetical protein
MTTPEEAARRIVGPDEDGYRSTGYTGLEHTLSAALLAAEARIRVLGDLIALADNLAHGVFKAGSKADTERNRHNAANLCNAIAKERNSGGAVENSYERGRNAAR